MTSVASATRHAGELRRLYGIEAAYTDLKGVTRTADPEVLVRVLAGMGADVKHPDDIGPSLRARAAELERQALEPVIVVPPDEPGRVPLRSGEGAFDCRLTTEDGETFEWRDEPGSQPDAPRVLRTPVALPTGYHDLEIEADGRSAKTRIVAAPPTVHDPERRAWSLFLPLYALRTRRDWGAGDLTDLEALVEWTAGLGGEMVGTLPLLSAFLGTPFDPSPYAPVSRLFWNELYADPEIAPELADCPEARAVLDSDLVRNARSRLRRKRLVDYRSVARLKRQVLEPLARSFFAGRGWDAPEFQRFLVEHPEARSYASFRATCEARGGAWRDWPARLRYGELLRGDYEDEAVRTHLYAQWLLARQLAALADRGRSGGAGLYLDLPLGVHPDGYDAWRYRELFAGDLSVGAPPDDFFAGGQDWGFPPLHPDRIREDGYRYLIAVLRTTMRYAGAVRIDHIMGLHRLFWVPLGIPATEGVYVRYPAAELWAILCLESHRNRTAIIGEDLGTVPPEVREAIDRHRARRMYVVPFELDPDSESGLEPVPERSAASLGTHDLPPFAAQSHGLPLEGALEHLARSPARLVIVNLEDLWREENPQNVPGTSMSEAPNWRRKARYQFETFREIPDVVEPLRAIDRLRRSGPAAETTA